MSRQEIINKIGQEYIDTNIENDEFSYCKAGICEAKGHYKLDLRFVDDKKKVAVLANTNDDRCKLGFTP